MQIWTCWVSAYIDVMENVFAFFGLNSCCILWTCVSADEPFIHISLLQTIRKGDTPFSFLWPVPLTLKGLSVARFSAFDKHRQVAVIFKV